MSDTPLRPSAQLFRPGTRWQDHVFGFISRDTRGCRLDNDEQLNRFPATPYCSITWFLCGGVDLIHHHNKSCHISLPAQVVNGCHTSPFISRNRGDVQAFVIVFYPEAFHALFGIDLDTIQNQFLDARQILPLHGLALLDRVSAARGNAARLHVAEEFLAAHAPTLDISAWTRLRRMGGKFSLRLACTILGVGARQVQRKARREGGLSMASMSRLWRANRSFYEARDKLREGQHVNWAEHATDAGYADQAHFSREVKAHTGCSPRHFLAHAGTDESYWVYRL